MSTPRCRWCKEPLGVLYTVMFDGGEKIYICGRCECVNLVTPPQKMSHPINEWNRPQGHVDVEKYPPRDGWLGSHVDENLPMEW